MMPRPGFDHGQPCLKDCTGNVIPELHLAQIDREKLGLPPPPEEPDLLEGVTLVRHQTPEEIFLAFWRPIFEESGPASDEDLRESVYGDVDEDGVNHERSFAGEVQALVENGMWGFAVPDRHEVHVWFDADKVKTSDLAMLLGHELGHLLPCPRPDCTEWEEEERADGYGLVAQKVVEWITNL